jgi:hypothetical protein
MVFLATRRPWLKIEIKAKLFIKQFIRLLEHSKDRLLAIIVKFKFSGTLLIQRIGDH